MNRIFILHGYLHSNYILSVNCILKERIATFNFNHKNIMFYFIFDIIFNQLRKLMNIFLNLNSSIFLKYISHSL